MTIDVRTHGLSGPTVVVLHGGPGAPGSASGLARALSGRFRVLEPLQRRSGAVPLSVDVHVADLAEIAPPRALLVGWSWGAMLGLSFAARHPDRVRALALVGCGTYGVEEREAYRQQMDLRLGVVGRERMAALSRALNAAADNIERDRVLAEMGQLATHAQSVDLIDDHEVEFPADAEGHLETWRDVLRLQQEGVEPAAFAAIRSPVVMLHGDDDPHPGQATRATLSQFIPQLAYVGVSHCGHLPWRERRARQVFLETLEDWLLVHATP